MKKKSNYILQLCSESEYGSWEFWQEEVKTEAEADAIVGALIELVHNNFIAPTEHEFVMDKTYTVSAMDPSRLKKEIIESIRGNIDPDKFYWFYASDKGKKMLHQTNNQVNFE